MEVKAPGVVKILGEHAVVYGKLSVAAAIDLNARAYVSATDSEFLEVALPDLKIFVNFDRGKLDAIYKSYRENSVNDFVSKSVGINREALPYATIAARLANEYGANLLGKRITLASDIPPQKGYASSTACSTAFAVALIGACGLVLPDIEIIDIARDGDRVMHLNKNAGAIDVGTSYYGGIVSFSKATGVVKQDVSAELTLVLIDTGPKKSTAETVGHIAETYKERKEYVDALMDRIDNCSADGLAALKSNDMKRLGELMYEDHEILRELGVSSDGLDKAVAIGKSVGAYGVKLSGGGGGGVAIAITENSDALINAMKNASFDAYKASVSKAGAAQWLGN